MSKIFVLAPLMIHALFVQTPGFSLTNQRRTIVNQTMTLMVNCEFDSVFSLCDSLSASDPADPMGDMLKLSAMGFIDLDCNHVSDSNGFFKQFAKTERAVFSYETKNGECSYSLTIKGFTKAIAACYFLWHKSYIKGLNTGFDALGILKEAKKADPENYDVDLFLGLYNYARADMKRMFWWAFFWYPGDRESGIRSIALCRKNGQFTRPVAGVVLAELWVKEKNYREAETIIAELDRDFPKSRLTRWTKAKYFEERGLHNKAADIFGGLADEYDLMPFAWRNALAARWKEASSWKSAGNRDRAERACERILSKKKDNRDPLMKQIIKDAENLLGNKKYTQ